MYTTLTCHRASFFMLRRIGGTSPTHSHRIANRCAAIACYLAILARSLYGQGQDLDFKVTHSTQRLDMIVNTSRILATDEDVPRVLVNNPDVLRVVPLAPRQIQVSALKPGVTQVNLWGPDGKARTVDIAVFRDSRQLELVLQAEFPKAAIRVRPLENSVILSGDVDRPEIVSRIVSIAQDYYPNVINNVNVGGVHQVLLHTKVMEVSRTKLRSIGVDWGVINGGDFLAQGAGGLVSIGASSSTAIAGTGQDTIRLGILNNGNQFSAFIDALRQHQVIKVLAEPTLTAISGRPATFNEGGEFPILVPQGLGQTAVEFKQFGTRVDFVPIVLGNNSIRLEVRPQVSEIDNSRSVTINGVSIPGLRTRFVDTGVEMRAGQTLALAGLIQTRTEGTNRGVPWLGDMPWAGNFFRRNREEVNEIELLVTVRPELVSGLDAHEAPTVGPGQMTTSPNDVEFYGRGYTEVPRCCPQQGCDQPGAPNQFAPAQGAYPDTGMSEPVLPYGPQDAAMNDNAFQAETMPSDGVQPMPLEENPAYQPIPEGAAPNAPMMNLEAPANTNAPQGELFGPSGYDDLN
jgi:pilus assembly protein CpaC